MPTTKRLKKNNPQRWLPPEWHTQSGVMLTWPHPGTDWKPNLPTVDAVFSEISFHISQREKLLIVCRDHSHKSHVQQQLTQRQVSLNNVRFFCQPSNDSWARDHGPISVYEHEKPCILDFRFNGWGDKYNATLDNQITSALARAKVFSANLICSFDFVLEGGAIEVDGNGTLLTTSKCLLAQSRNPQFNKQQIEYFLSKQLGITHFLWLEHGELIGDDTDGHIDTLARFCNDNTIVYCQGNKNDHQHYDPLLRMETQLKTFNNALGSPYELIPLPMPQPIYSPQGERLPATYANFLIINDAVLVPVYNDKADAIALQTLAICFPQREIISINCVALIQQFGSLHCVTMQLPEGVLT